MLKIIGIIQKWTENFCLNSLTTSDGQDLKNFRLMMRLLQSKGYRCSKRQATKPVPPAAQLNNLRPTCELKQEYLEFQEAKLRELLRRGKPSDLEKANELMKSISGYEKRDSDFVEQNFKKDLDAIQQRLYSIQVSLKECTSRQDLYAIVDIEDSMTFCRVLQAKIAKIIEKEENDQYYEQLFRISECVNSTISDYDRLQNIEAFAIKLIDFDDVPAATPLKASAKAASPAEVWAKAESAVQKSPSTISAIAKRHTLLNDVAGLCAAIEVKRLSDNRKLQIFLEFKRTKEDYYIEDFCFEMASVKHTRLELGPLNKLFITKNSPTPIEQTSILHNEQDIDIVSIFFHFN